LPPTLPRETLSEALFVRLCRTAHAAREPWFRSTATYRFDAPDRSFGTLYAARNFKTCFFETIVRDRPGFQIARTDYDARSVVLVLLSTLSLNLVPIYGAEGQRLRIDPAKAMGERYDYPQALAKAFHDHPDRPHGIVYRSRFDDDTLAVVLFDRARRHVRLFPRSRPVALGDARELGDGVRHTFPFELV
jgi:hypothetical protein